MYLYLNIYLLCVLVSSVTYADNVSDQPNIILIVADDLGYNDVSWHNPDILTPHMERLARAGVILEQSYVQPICTPTRSALMTGRYPIHTGEHRGATGELQGRYKAA